MVEQVKLFIGTTGIEIALRIAGAIALWIAGRWLIGWTEALVRRAMASNKVDPTLTRYAGSTLAILLNVVLVIGILGYFGVQTTSFAALLVGAGLAIGGAWAGLLGNFAAGAFLVMFRPFKVGDLVNIGGNLGQVKEIGIFGTTLLNDERVQIVVGNGKVFGGDIVNYSAQPVRRVDRVAQISGTVDPREAIEKLRAAVENIPNVAKDPKPDVAILDFNPAGALIAVRPYTPATSYWQVFFDTNQAIAAVGAAAKWPTPAPTTIVKPG